MSEQHSQEEILSIIKEIEVDPATTQRTLAKRLGISLGKTNYLLKELLKKGLIEARNLTDLPGRLRKIQYILTKEGFEHKVKLMFYFLDVKEKEYSRLKEECKQLAVNNHIPQETVVENGQVVATLHKTL